ncbi:MAG TPA: mechanosensitive ion channel family protein [Longimicrobiales bacterium]|nr:mechanosensitive ion channel family protein [Longimicrobiales bacterium]
MEILQYSYYENSLQTWAIALGIMILVTIGLGIATRFIIRNVRRFSKVTANELDDVVVAILEKTKTFFYLAMGVVAASQILILPERGRAALNYLVLVALALQLGIWGSAAIRASLKRYADQRMEKDPASATTVIFMGFILQVTLWVIIFLVTLDTMGVDVTALIAGLGIGGIAVALAVQNVLGDLLASLSIVLDKPFVVGDFIVVGDLSGNVEHIGLKTTRVRSLSGEELVFSNNDLLSSRIHNYKKLRERRIVFAFGLVYQTSRELLEQIPDVVKEAVEAVENTRFDRAHLKSFGASSLDFEVVYYMLVPEYNAYMDAQQAINLILFSRFEELGAEFAYPTQTLFVTREDATPQTA